MRTEIAHTIIASLDDKPVDAHDAHLRLLSHLLIEPASEEL